MTDQKQFLALATIEYFPDAGVASVLVHKPFLIVMDVYIACCMGNEFFLLTWKDRWSSLSSPQVLNASKLLKKCTQIFYSSFVFWNDNMTMLNPEF